MTRDAFTATDVGQPATGHAAGPSVKARLVAATPIEVLLAQFAEDITRIEG